MKGQNGQMRGTRCAPRCSSHAAAGGAGREVGGAAARCRSLVCTPSPMLLRCPWPRLASPPQSDPLLRSFTAHTGLPSRESNARLRRRPTQRICRPASKPTPACTAGPCRRCPAARCAPNRTRARCPPPSRTACATCRPPPEPSAASPARPQGSARAACSSRRGLDEMDHGHKNATVDRRRAGDGRVGEYRGVMVCKARRRAARNEAPGSDRR